MEFDGDPWETRMPAFGMNPVNLDMIITEYVNPPIPNRGCDWSAVYEGYEPVSAKAQTAICNWKQHRKPAPLSPRCGNNEARRKVLQEVYDLIIERIGK